MSFYTDEDGKRRFAMNNFAWSTMNTKWWTNGSGLDLDFVNNVGFNGSTSTDVSNLLTVSRASTAYIDDYAGNWILHPANVLRRTNKGALIEEARTNLNPNSLPANNISPFSPNTAVITADISPLFPGAGIVKHTRDTGAGDSNVGALSGMTGWALSTTYTASAWIYVPTNPNITQLELKVEAAAPWAVTSIGFADLAKRNQWQRISGQITSAGAGAANPAMLLRMVATTGDFIYSTGWQFEAGSFPTSLIGTSGGAATRAADVVTLNDLTSVNSAVGFSAIVRVVPTHTGTSAGNDTSPFSLRLDSNNRATIYFTTANYRYFDNRASVGQDCNSGIAPVVGIRAKIGVTSTPLKSVITVNGSIPTVIVRASEALPTFATAYVGGNNVVQGGFYVERLTVMPPVADAALQAAVT